MKTEYTKPLYAQAKKPAPKIKIDKRRLFTVFACAFVLFFLVCTVIATMLTPKIDVPALNNNQEVIPSLTSDDFKGRVDARLKLIEQQENAPPAQNTVSNQGSGNTGPTNNSKASPQPNMGNNNPNVNNNADNYQESDPIPYKGKNNKNSDILMPEDLQYQGPQKSSPVSQAEKPARAPVMTRRVQPAPTPSYTQNLDLREKVNNNDPPTPNEDQ